MKYEFITWFKDESTNSDKVWGIILLAEDVPVGSGWHFPENKYITFWGRRGAKLQTKLWGGSNWDAKEMFLKKQDKGYRAVELDELNTVYPEFQQDLEKTAVWSMLKI